MRYCSAYNVSCRGYQGWSKGGGGINKGLLYRVADNKADLRGEGVLLRVCFIVSGIPRVV